jgi:hypothetical protein
LLSVNAVCTAPDENIRKNCFGERVERRAPSGLSDAESVDVIAALEEIDARYERDRETIQNSLGPEQSKARLLARLQARRLAERAPLVQCVLQLAPSGEPSSRDP